MTRTYSGERVPRPLGNALHGTRPNEIIHLDYCFIPKAATGESYVLMVKDDLRGYTWLYPCESFDA